MNAPFLIRNPLSSSSLSAQSATHSPLKLLTGACEAQKELKGWRLSWRSSWRTAPDSEKREKQWKISKWNRKWNRPKWNKCKKKNDHLQNQKIYESMMYIKTDLASALWDRNWEDGDQQQAPVQWGSVQLNLCKNISIMSPCQSTIHLLTPQTKKACCESCIRFFFLHSKSYLESWNCSRSEKGSLWPHDSYSISD